MPSQATANKKKEQLRQLTLHDFGGRPASSLSSTPIHKIDTQDLQGTEDGRLEISSKNEPIPQLDSSVASYTLGRPPLYAALGGHIHKVGSTDIADIAVSESLENKVPTKAYRPATALPFPKRCPARALTGSVLPTKKQDESRLFAKGTRAASDTQPISTDVFSSTVTLSCKPWTGDGPEDRLTDIAVKEGYSVRSTVFNESARSTFWPLLKSGTGLAALSDFFSDVVAERQQAGRVDAASTFKPPPRVALTDTKREAWLRDLANSSVSLKRLSRTIPHGLRGRALLDQCSIKNVPAERTVWLARCVGANDLRAFRRKGVIGGVVVDNELKWGFEWTNIVESFISDCIDSLSQVDWKARFVNVAQITSLLFDNHLLDNGHFLSWLLDNLNACSDQALTSWLAFSSRYLSAIVQDCSRGRRVVEVLFGRISKVIDMAQTNLALHLKERLQRLIYILITSSPICILMPEQCDLVRRVLKNVLVNRRNEEIQERIRGRLNRNERLVATAGGDCQSPAGRSSSLYAFLDDLSTPLNTESISSRCMQLSASIEEGVLNLLKWASNPYSASRYRKYLVLSILSQWAGQGRDLTKIILDLLPTLDKALQLDSRIISDIVAELARKNLFNAGSALRWFIVSGAISGLAENEKLSCTKAILLDIPEGVLAPSVVNIRRMLIRSAGFSTTQEMDVFKRIKQSCECIINGMRGPLGTGMTWKNFIMDLDLKSLSCGALFELTSWLQKQLDLTSPLEELQDDLEMNNVARTAVFILDTLDRLGDYCTLVHFCHQIISIKHSDVLGCIADLVWRNRAILTTMSAGKTLPRKILDHYCLLRVNSPPSRLIVDPLLSLFRFLHIEGRIIEYLEHEVVLWDHNLTFTTASPLSDFQVENPQTGANLLEDLENIVACNLSADESTAQRVYGVLSARWYEMKDLARSDEVGITIMLSHLLKAFSEDLPQTWLQNMLSIQYLHDGEKILSTLYKIGAFTMGMLVEAAKTVHRQTTDVTRNMFLCFGSLHAMTDILGVSFVNERLENGDHKVATSWTADYVFFLRASLLTQRDEYLNWAPLLLSKSFVSVFSYMLAHDSSTVRRVLDVETLLSNKDAAPNLHFLVLRLLDPLNNLELRMLSDIEVIQYIFDAVESSFSAVFEFALACILSIERRYGNNGTELNSTLLDIPRNMANKDRKDWVKLLSILDNDVLAAIGKASAANLLLVDDKSDISLQLGLMQATARFVPEAVIMELCQHSVQALTTLVDNRHESRSASTHDATLFEAFLEICLMHRRTLFQQAGAQSLKEELVLVLCRFMAGRYPELPESTFEFALDVAACFVEDLSTQAKQQIRHNLGPLSIHPLIKYLLGIQDRPNGWLYAVSEQERAGDDNVQPFTIKPWEMLEDATPVVGTNDTALDLRLFSARKV